MEQFHDATVPQRTPQPAQAQPRGAGAGPGSASTKSAKQIKQKQMILYSEDKSPCVFPLYKDRDLIPGGLWAKYVIEKDMDDDVNTDDEQL